MPSTPGSSEKASTPKKVLVTGVTGQQGGHLARLLLKRGHRVRGLTRKPEAPASADLRKVGVEIVAGDLGDRASVERAAKGMDAVFVVATPFELGPAAETRFGTNGVDAAHDAGVPHIVYSSVSDADRHTGIPHFDSKFEVEKHLHAVGGGFTIIAPVFFMENLRAPWMSQGYAQGVIAMGVAPDRKLQVITLPEIAAFSALAIENPASFAQVRLNIASDDLTPVDMARYISDAAGRKLNYVAVPIEQIRAQSEDMAKMIDWLNRTGYSVDIPTLKQKYPRIPWTSFRDWAAAQDWSKVLPRNSKP